MVVTPEHGEYITCGYSPRAMLCVIFIGLMMIAIMVAFSKCRLSSSMPIAASCSASNSALCHPIEKHHNAALELIQWGVVKAATRAEMGHCSFSCQDVDEPCEGKMYA